MDLDTQMYFHLLRNLLTKCLKMIKKSLRNLFHRLLTNWKKLEKENCYKSSSLRFQARNFP